MQDHLIISIGGVACETRGEASHLFALKFLPEKATLTCDLILCTMPRIKVGFFHRTFDHFPGECVRFEGSK